MSTIHGGRIVAQALKAEGVSHLFTLSGGHIQSIYDGCLDEGIRVVDVRHEQTAAHAADGWARVTGRPGVAAVTAGPGVTDAVTGVANAFRAQVPMVLIGGQGPRMFADMGSLQDMDHVTLLRSITKWSATVPDARRLGEYLQSAFRIATQGVPGPVFLEMPLDLLMDQVDPGEVTRWPGYRTEARPAGDPTAVAEAAARVARAHRPVLVVGSQLRWSPVPEAVSTFLEAWPMPTFFNGMARGFLPPGHPAVFGQVRKQALAEADLVLLFGTPLDFRLGYGREPPFAADATLVQVDLDGTEIGRNRRIDVGVVGDTGLVLQGLLAALGERRPPKDQAGWLDKVGEWEATRRAGLAAQWESEADPPNPLRVCAEVDRRLDEDAIVVGDGGDFVASAAYTLQLRRPFSWMDPGPLGTLGVGPGYAMAAALAHPDRQVVVMYGDGAFGLHGMEIEAMVRQGLPVKMVVGNDAAWTQIRRGQVAMYGEERAVATDLSFAAYEEVARGLGAHGERVDHQAQLGPALDRAFAAEGPALVNVRIGQSDFRKHAISV